MKKEKVMNKVIKIAVCALVPLVLGARENLRELDGIAAVVGDSIILKSQVNEFVEMKIQATGGTADAMVRSMLYDESLDQMIDEKVLVVHAVNDTNLAIRSSDIDQQVNARIASIMQQNNISEEQLAQALMVEQQMTLQEFRARLSVQIEQDMVRQSVNQFYLAGAELSKEEVRQFFEGYRDSLPSVGESIRLQKLEIALKPDSTLRQNAYESVTNLHQQITERGEDFGELAKEYSSGPNASNGGNLGFISKGTFQLIRLEQEIFTLQPGEVSNPIETKLGFHLVKVVERRDSRVHALHILIPVSPSEERTLEVSTFCDSIKATSPSEEDFIAIIEEESTEPISRAYNGDTDWLLLESLDQATQNALGDFTIGTYSDVVSADNTFYIYRIADYNQNRPLDIDSDWNMIEQFARQMLSEDRMEALVEQWRNEIFIQKYR